jgi:hypothetical protein
VKFFGGGDIVRDATSNRIDLWYKQAQNSRDWRDGLVPDG